MWLDLFKSLQALICFLIKSEIRNHLFSDQSPPFSKFGTEKCPQQNGEGLILCYPSLLLKRRGIPSVKPKHKYVLSGF